MTDNYWDGTPDGPSYGEAQSNTFIRVNGSERPLEAGLTFAEAVKSTARDAGLGKFRVFLNGSEIRPADAPSVIEEGMQVELKPYDVAG